MRMHHDPAAVGLPCACAALRKASRALSRVYDAALAPAGLGVAQLSVLRVVHRHGTLPLSRLAEALVMDRTSLYRALAPMRRDGWLAIADGASGRAKHVSLTEDGRRVLAEAAPHWEDAQRRVVETFGVESWAALHDGIARLTAVGVAVGVTAGAGATGAEP
jgi:DNA-binding MarR family transcriptional regulator